MTKDDAIDRALDLWGHNRIVDVFMLESGAADVRLSLPHAPFVTTEYHRLDRHGRPDCHPECLAVVTARRQA